MVWWRILTLQRGRAGAGAGHPPGQVGVRVLFSQCSRRGGFGLQLHEAGNERQERKNLFCKETGDNRKGQI